MDKRLTTKASTIANQSIHQQDNTGEDEIHEFLHEADVIETNPSTQVPATIFIQRYFQNTYILKVTATINLCFL